jgi:23S rRNA pseudouridine1911/1915/1917 synthase
VKNTDSIKIRQSDILFEDNHIIAVNKKAGEIVQPDKTGDDALEESVKLFLKTKYNKPGNVYLGVTHRIDRPVSGIVMFAKTSKALARLNNMFQNREIQKTYLVVSRGRPEETSGRLTHYLVRDQQKNKSFVHKNEVPNSSKSELTYFTEAVSDSFSLIRVLPHTGRHHQIRVQMASMGCPITGDVKYGDRRANEDRSICLHAFGLSFKHPVTDEQVNITAPLPKHKFWQIFKDKSNELAKQFA